MPITKHNYFVGSVEQLADTVREAFRLAVSGRPGPVLIDVPKDVQVAMCEYTPMPPVMPDEKKAAKDIRIEEAGGVYQYLRETVYILRRRCDLGKCRGGNACGCR